MIGAEDEGVGVDQKDASLSVRRQSGRLADGSLRGGGVGFLLGRHREMLANK
jgi:hypothetical protein